MGCNGSSVVIPFAEEFDRPHRGSTPCWAVAKALPSAFADAPHTQACALDLQPLSSLPWAVSEGDSSSCGCTEDADSSCEGSLYDWQPTESPHPPGCQGEWEPSPCPAPTLPAPSW
eukprot:EG_transcript_6547